MGILMRRRLVANFPFCTVVMEACGGAASRPSMSLVPIKQAEQQDIQSMYRVRTRIVKNRTALIKEITPSWRECMRDLYEELVDVEP
tara:strand:- start:1984 stop:2244 length:261 start_codon:yes stop_codon:yes gene_type:complete